MNEEEFEKLAQKLERYSAADIRGIVEEAYRQKKFQALTLDDLLSTLPRYKPIMTLEMRDRYQKLVVKYSRHRRISPLTSAQSTLGTKLPGLRMCAARYVTRWKKTCCMRESMTSLAWKS